jgi:EmrB/QacA subfamily drug resistance transporter
MVNRRYRGPMPSGQPDPRLRLVLAWLAGFTLIDSSIVSLALPDIAQDFDRSVGELAWVSTGYLLALAATLLSAGRLNDRYGSRPVLTIGAVAFLILTLAAGLAPTFELLVAARIGQGIAGGILYTVSLAIVVTVFPPERRAWAIGVYFTSGALGAVIGPVVGGFLTDLGGWRLVFLAQLPLPALVTLGARLLLPAGAGRPRPMDLPGLVAASTFMVAATLALLELAVPGAGGIALTAGVVAAVALASFVAIERRVAEPAVRLAIFTNPRFVAATTAGAGAWFAIMSSVIYAAIFLQLGRGLSATDAGLILLSSPLIGLIFFPFSGRFVTSIGVEPAMRLGLAILITAAALMVTWDASTPIWLVIVTQLLNGAGISITLVASADDAMAQFTPAEAGTGSALFNSLRQLGAAMGVAIPAVAFELLAAGSRTTEAALAGSTAAFGVRLAILAIPLLLAVALRSRRRVEVTARAHP